MTSVQFDLDTPDLAECYDTATTALVKGGLRLVGALAIGRGDRVLDVGCGTGLLAAEVAAIVGPAGEVVGIDPLALRIAIARRHERANVKFLVGDALDLGGLPERHFDAAYLHVVLHWIRDKAKALRQVHRVLRRGGRVGVTMPVRGTHHSFERAWTEVLSAAKYGALGGALAGARPEAVGVDDLSRLLDAAGLDIERIAQEPSIGVWQNADGPDGVIAFFETLSFGNLFGHLPPALQPEARADLAAALERSRTAAGIRFEGTRMVAIGVRR